MTGQNTLKDVPAMMLETLRIEEHRAMIAANTRDTD
jgi:hypothetical protein